MLVEWRSVSTKRGELCVTVDGMQQMQMLFAVNWGSCVMVRPLGTIQINVEWDLENTQCLI